MKNICALLFLLFSLPGLSQDLAFEVRGMFGKPIKKEALNNAQTLSDINPGYPSSWIKESDYISSVFRMSVNGKVQQAMGTNNILNQEQIDLCTRAEMGANIQIEVKYNSKDGQTNTSKINTMNFSVSLVPEIQAEFSGGYEKLKEYLKEHAILKLPALDVNQFSAAIVRFTINEEGFPINAKMSMPSEDINIDNILLKAIKNMPQWKPAENGGLKLKQDFEFSIGNAVGC